MASVTSLDQDMKRLRLGKANPQASNEARTWIEGTLGQKLPPGDLMDALKDGTALCQLANLALPPPGIKFKKSAMPFMQMENISHFLKACEQPPFNLHAHDRFLTVDLYEKKDPAQVLQCIGAFSRVAHAANPSKFPTCIGPKKSGMSPATTGNGGLTAGGYSSSGFGRNRGLSNVSTGSSSTTPGAKFAPIKPLSPSVTGGSASSSNGTKSPGPVSTWSKRSDQGVTAPAWNIAQYGYMGGANQGSQGVAFGARRQITSAAPHVPSLAEKERKRKEQEAEAERLRLQAEEAEHKRRVEREAEEEQARIEEDRRWEEETRRRREEEKRKVEQQKREWEDQERRWKEEDERKMREEKEAQQKLETETHRPRGASNAALRGQYLSDYQAQQGIKPRSRQVSRNDPELEAERTRVAELERQLAEAKERERQYQREREGRARPESSAAAAAPARPPSPPDSNVSWAGDEREYLRSQWQQNQQRTSRPLPEPKAVPALPSRPLPEQPSAATAASPPTSPRPLPNPPSVASPKSPASARSMPLSPVPKQSPSSIHTSPTQAQQKKPGSGWASKSLLEREMERERERQREWEEGQKRVASAARDVGEGSGPGQSWDVHQYGYVGGDSQNKVGTGINFGGRRQILGPRNMPPP
ncbi:calponin [Phyllosticta capitalensis]|uniref:Calponin n=1 Tax=Phyllosticta capitalensis TaxID=121624 RepID=A0ABR1YZZ1_9PEZI